MAKFRTRARTVDMLGRQQIAGIPTAISELFKNAYDAYASHIEVDFYRPENLLVLRDDGLGMTDNDVLDRWLVVGTESKLDNSGGLASVASSLGLPFRQPTGEKGIGRLAIASIGPQVVLVSRGLREGDLCPTVASFVNWTLFSLPGISLDEIDVPVKVFKDGRLPTSNDLDSMVESVQSNVWELRHRIAPDSFSEICHQLESVSLDVDQLQRRFTNASLQNSASGTQFFIQPVDSMLADALDEEPQRRRANDLQKMLMGFTNTMMPGAEDPPVVTEFRDHKSRDFSESIIGPDEFFTPEDFDSADHHFHGEFDEYGQFVGTVGLYGADPEPHSIIWPEARGRKTECGPFRIDFAYIQGAARESRMPQEEWGRLVAKLDRMGGLYIYRNGIRILPYGNVDYDYLHLEERRNLSAGYYFFSYRRMFGVIDLPASSSTNLNEKAGREGFRENRAYKQFRAILEHFFIQLAADFFREETARGALYRAVKSDLDRQARARERQARLVQSRRRELVRDLADRSQRLQEHEPQRVVDSTVESLIEALEAVHDITDPDQRIRAIFLAERSARERIANLRDEFRIKRPRGIGLSQALRRDLAAYRVEYKRLETEDFRPALNRIEDILGTTIEQSGLDVSRRRRFDASTQATRDHARSAIRALRRDSEAILDSTTTAVREAIRQTFSDFELVVRDVERRVQQTNLASLSDAEIVALSLDLDSEIETVTLQKQGLLDSISEQLELITVTPDDEGEIVTHLDVIEAAEEELIALQERAAADLELIQLGMAIEIIDHEFQATIRAIRNSLRRLRAWANVNEDLQSVYDGIRTNFEHLDGYLTLFTPMHRRLYRTEVQINCGEIARFLSDLFRERLRRHRVEINVSRQFLNHSIVGYPSTFYPVFVNLLDNAIFWLRDQPEPREIRLDFDGQAMIISDTGPGIDPLDREAVFEPGFTRKPGGRGMGLYISRDVLKKAGYELILGPPADGVGATFRIEPIEDEDD